MERHKKLPSVSDYYINRETFTFLSFLQTTTLPNLDRIWYNKKTKEPNIAVNELPDVLFTRNGAEWPEMGEKLSAVQLCASLVYPLTSSVKQGVQPGDPIPWQQLSTPEALWLPVVASYERLDFQVETLVKSLPAC